MKRYDVLFVLPMPTLKIVGGYKMIYEYANYIAQNGYKTCIVYNANKGKNSRRLPKLLVYPIRKLLGFFGPNWFALDKLVKQMVIPDFQEKYLPFSNKIIASTAQSAVFVNTLKDKTKEKYYFVQGFEDWELSTEELYETYAYDMKIITVAAWLQNEIKKHAKYPVSYIPNGINHDIFRVIKSFDDRDQHTVAMLYHNDERKGCDIGFEVLYRLKEKYPDLTAHLFGSPNKNPEWPVWISYDQNATPAKVSSIMNNCEVFLCTSRSEGYGLTGLESLFCGCILVTTNCKGIMEYATKDNSMICDVDDVEGLTNSVSRIFEDFNLKNSLLKNTESILEKFDINQCKQEFLKVITK